MGVIVVWFLWIGLIVLVLLMIEGGLVFDLIGLGIVVGVFVI